ncbi:MAG TPA: DUF3426 domain-containing protein [Gammaproteobacteria bacterium]|jgi:predicted Zn finger-like uncharacterized protein|nr:zinc-ribbon and DUF3426 domain-containing protein [Gammaproteobacteria bacterium]RTZ64645.1 MAG: hypothetical protein DSZ34_05880 [Gammaproteobacteria bacterium]HHZ71994.1 DUF3426 domain-containing protein [Gammaproteobacteria bacterium]HIA41484.1 DUF3426 domain-containing protein [Gammaproteobacteria bacterium]HIB06330.1 DUF3426 domain-containing protein [Gammaproteobacteria bacterium]
MTYDEQALLETRCSGCKSILPVTADTLAAGAGLVQCGECDTVFNAAWNLVEQIANPTQARSLQNRLTTRVSTDRIPEFDRSKVDPRPRLFDLTTEQLGDLQLPATETEGLDEINRALRRERGFGPTGNQKVPDSRSTTYRTEPRLSLSDSVRDSTSTDTPALSRSQLRTEHQAPATSRSLIWFIASVVAVLALFLQTRYVLFDQLTAIPAARPYLVQVCKNMGCSVPLPLSGPVFRVIETKVDLHPDIPGAVIVEVHLLNRSTQHRSYPAIELALSDRNGRIVGRRTYSPESILTIDDLDKKVPPGADVTVVVNLAQPEDNAVGFEARIVSS